MIRTTHSPDRPARGMSFALTLVSEMERHEISRRQLARRSGFDLSYISRLCSGKRCPTRSAVLAIARALGCDDVARDRLLVAGGWMPLDHNLQHMIRLYLNMPAAISEGTCAA